MAQVGYAQALPSSTISFQPGGRYNISHNGPRALPRALGPGMAGAIGAGAALGSGLAAGTEAPNAAGLAASSVNSDKFAPGATIAAVPQAYDPNNPGRTQPIGMAEGQPAGNGQGIEMSGVLQSLADQYNGGVLPGATAQTGIAAAAPPANAMPIMQASPGGALPRAT